MNYVVGKVVNIKKENKNEIWIYDIQLRLFNLQSTKLNYNFNL
jgi:hypothetical protein